jgi:hypothetical protein
MARPVHHRDTSLCMTHRRDKQKENATRFPRKAVRFCFVGWLIFDSCEHSIKDACIGGSETSRSTRPHSGRQKLSCIPLVMNGFRTVLHCSAQHYWPTWFASAPGWIRGVVGNRKVCSSSGRIGQHFLFVRHFPS